VDDELDLLLGTAIDDLTKLVLVLDLHGSPGSARSPGEIAARVRQPEEVVTRALTALAAAGLVEQFRLGTGRLSMYGPSDDEHVRSLLDLLQARYHAGPQSRGQVVRQVLRMAAAQREEAQE
jgi:DNA-binding transcriptional ArsR family regulator